MRLTRRNLMGLLAGAGSSLLAKALPRNLEADATRIAEGPFKGTRQSLQSYQVPDWFRDAKFGIWSHWGPQSAIEAGDWYARNMYMQDSEQYNYHLQRFGHPSQVGYKDTISQWKAEKFDPANLMRLYRKAGAKYFLSMGVHHDNFDLWDSKYQPWNAVKVGPHKDIVGMWQEAARAEGLKFGISEHLWLSYIWFSVSHGGDHHGPLAGVPYDGADPRFEDLYIDSDQIWNDIDWSESGIPCSWKQHWLDRIKDVIERYPLDLLYTDGALPFEDHGYKAVAHFYNLNAQRNGGKVDAVYFSKRVEDSVQGLCVLDCERTILPDISRRPWQTDTCIGDWHYKLGMHYKTAKRVIDMLADVVSRNGNLLLNFPLPASGELDPEELEILASITDWMAINGDAIFATRPWQIPGEGPPVVLPSATGQGPNEDLRKELTKDDIRFTTKAKALFVLVMGWPDYQIRIKSLAQNTALRVGRIENVELLGDARKLAWRHDREGLVIMLPREAPCQHAVTFRVMGAL